MRISVLINNYNYGRFLERCLASVLAQNSRALHEIIVVDDGSSDDSIQILTALANQDQRIQVISKPNGGQLSAFNAGFEKVTGDVVCFLDADDEYNPGYLNRLVEVFQAKPQVDFIFCRCETIGLKNHSDPPWELFGNQSFDYGLSHCRTLFLRQWIGAPTSCIAAKRPLLSRFLPCAREADWRVRADDVLVYGSSIFQGNKYYLAEKWIRYHCHGNNLWLNKSHDSSAADKHSDKVEQLMSHWTNEPLPAFIQRDDIGETIVFEFKTIPSPGDREFRHYSRMIQRFSRRRKFYNIWRIWRHWRLVRRHQHQFNERK